YQVQGSKVYKTILIPTASGDVAIPPISFVYFDPSVPGYKTLKSPAMTVHVKPAPAGAAPLAATPSNSAAPQGINILNEDIRYIRTPASIKPQGPPLYQRMGYRLTNALVLLGFLVCGVLPVYRRMFLSNPDLLRFKNAKGQAEQWI